MTDTHSESDQQLTVVAQAKTSLVEIFTSAGIGAGFLVHEDGFILTNKHVTGMSDAFTIRLLDETLCVASFLAADPDVDLAVLKANMASASVLSPGWGAVVSEGQRVYALGHPFGLSFSVTKGIVSSADRMIDGVHYVQTDVAMNPGNSGGPLINARGILIGVNTMTFRGSEGLGFAIGLVHMKEFLQRLGLR